MVELGEEGGGFALEAVFPVDVAEAESKTGEDRGEVVDGGYGSVAGVQWGGLAFGEDRGGKRGRIDVGARGEWVFAGGILRGKGCWRCGWDGIEDSIEVASEDVDELSTGHIGPHGVIKCYGRLGCRRRLRNKREEIGSICDAVLEYQSLSVFADVGYPRARGQDVNITVEQLKLEKNAR